MEQPTSPEVPVANAAVEQENRGMLVAVAMVVLIVVIGIVVFLIAQNNKVTPTPTPTPTNTPTPVSSTDDEGTTFILTAQNGSEQDGTAEFTVDGSTTRVYLKFPTGVSTPEPAHIHLGACPTPGAVAYALEDVVNGESLTVLNVTLADLRDLGDIAINVHKSAEESNVYVSCGDIKLQ